MIAVYCEGLWKSRISVKVCFNWVSGKVKDYPKCDPCGPQGPNGEDFPAGFIVFLKFKKCLTFVHYSVL